MATLHYAQSWEDPRLLWKAWSDFPCDEVHLIASGGDHALELLHRGIPRIHVYDTEVAQLKHIEQKILALDSPHRDRLFGAGAFALKGGLLHAGRLEGYLRTFSRTLLPVLVSRRTREALYETTDIPSQLDFYHSSQWQSKRWRWFAQRYFSPERVNTRARHPGLIQNQGRSAVTPNYLAQFEQCLATHRLADNPYLDYLLFGGHAHGDLPYLKGDLHDVQPRILLHPEGLQQALQKLPPAPRFIHASDILEGYPSEGIDDFFRTINQSTTSGSTLVFWDHRFQTTPPAFFLESWCRIAPPFPDRVPFYHRYHIYHRP